MALAVYFHETHVKYTCYTAQARTCRGRTARNRMPGRRGRLVFPGRGLAVIAPCAGAPSLHMTASDYPARQVWWLPPGRGTVATSAAIEERV